VKDGSNLHGRQPDCQTATSGKGELAMNPSARSATMVTIDELCAEVYEDVNPRVEDVRREGNDGLIVVFSTDAWKSDGRRTFAIACHQVADWNAWAKPVEGIEWVEDHPLLWTYNCEPAYVHFTSAPRNAFEIVGRLYETHEEMCQGWIPMREYFNRAVGHRLHSLIEGGRGMLARGPKNVMEAYIAAIQKLMEVNMNVSTDSRYRPAKLRKALVFDDMYVICEAVTVKEAEPTAQP
jgi:hypothetical protein